MLFQLPTVLRCILRNKRTCAPLHMLLDGMAVQRFLPQTLVRQEPVSEGVQLSAFLRLYINTSWQMHSPPNRCNGQSDGQKVHKHR